MEQDTIKFFSFAKIAEKQNTINTPRHNVTRRNLSAAKSLLNKCSDAFQSFRKFFSGIVPMPFLKALLRIEVLLQSLKVHALFKSKNNLTLKVPITTAANDIYKYFFIVFQRK